MNKYEEIQKDALWVIELFGSNAEETKTPGSKAKAQAARIAEFARQWDEGANALARHELDLIRITSIY